MFSYSFRAHDDLSAAIQFGERLFDAKMVFRE